MKKLFLLIFMLVNCIGLYAQQVMETPVLIIAAVLFVLGMLVRKYPNLIAGYNTMTAEQKKNVDVKGLSNFMCRSLCVIAVLMIVSYFVMVARSVNEKAVSVVSTTLIPIIGSIYMVVKAQRYDRNGK